MENSFPPISRCISLLKLRIFHLAILVASASGCIFLCQRHLASFNSARPKVFLPGQVGPSADATTMPSGPRSILCKRLKLRHVGAGTVYRLLPHLPKEKNTQKTQRRCLFMNKLMNLWNPSISTTTYPFFWGYSTSLVINLHPRTGTPPTLPPPWPKWRQKKNLHPAWLSQKPKEKKITFPETGDCIYTL